MAYQLSKEDAIKLINARMEVAEKLIREAREISDESNLGFDFPYINATDYTEGKWQSSSYNC